MKGKPAKARPPIALVAAVAKNGVIGAGGDLPWRLKSELRRFRELTWGAPIVMGRKTWESLPKRPLQGRVNIVLTRDVGYAAPGAIVCPDVASAREVALREARALGQEVMVIGGEAVYRAFMGDADILYLTEVDAEPEGDAHFPAIDESLWRLKDRKPVPREAADDHDYAVSYYERR